MLEDSRLVRVKARAKINLTLDVLGKLSDGYHEISTVMQSIDLFDNITLEKTEQTGIRLEIKGKDLPNDETNLAYKAARLFLDTYGKAEGIFIKIKKNIPLSAGLGGGSADAAAVLHGLNELFDLNLKERELLKLGEKIGFDVPFCLLEGTMLATGKGEKLKRLTTLPTTWIVLAKPPVAVSTKWAYDAYDKLSEKPLHIEQEAMIRAIDEQNIEKIAQNLSNNLEAPVIQHYPLIAEYKKFFEEHRVFKALMSGSGSAVFAVPESRYQAEVMADIMKQTMFDAEVFVVSTTGQR